MREVKLGDYITLTGGGTPSKDIGEYWDGDIPWTSVKDMKTDYISQTARNITALGVEKSSTKIIPKGTLIVATRMAVGRVVFPLMSTAINQDLKAVNCNKEIDKKFLFYFFKQKASYFNRISTGATVKGIKIRDILETKLVLPQLTKQKKIAAILDEADKVRQLNRRLLAAYDALSQSLFLEMFGDPVTNPKGWGNVKFQDVGTLERGKSKHRPRNATQLLGGKYPLIQTGDVANSGGYIKNYNSTYSELGLAQSRMWKAGTLCITIAANIAKTGILTFDSCFPDSVVGFLANEKTNNDYVQYWLSFLQKILEDKAPESAQKNINLNILRNLSFPLPPIALQTEFATRIAAIEAQKTQAAAALSESEDLFSALLQEVF